MAQSNRLESLDLTASTSRNSCSPSSKLIYTSDKHPMHLLKELNTLRSTQQLCDVILKIRRPSNESSGDEESVCFYAHRLILSAFSSYFKAMFTSNLVESREKVVTLHGISEVGLKLLLDYAYTSSIVIDDSNVQVLLPAASLLLINDIKDVCCEYLGKRLTPSNCLGIKAFAYTHMCPELLSKAKKFCEVNFEKVVESEEFIALSEAELIEYINSDEINVDAEKQVFDAIVAWISHKEEERKSSFYNVLLHVRLPLMSAKFLVEIVSNYSLVRKDVKCRDLLDEAKNYLLLPNERFQLQSMRTKARRPRRANEVLFIVGGWCHGDATSTVERYECENDDWCMCAPMSKQRCGVGVAIINHMLYAIGGHDGESYLNSIERFDIKCGLWQSDVIAHNSTCRTSVGVGVLNGAHLYVVGGQDGVSCLNLVERYNVYTNKWTRAASMNVRRLGVAVVALCGQLYAIGGADGTSPLSSVERYDPATNTWSYVASMKTRRKHLGAAVLGNHIYAVGGRDESIELSSAERYNYITNTWTSINSMTSRRSGVSLGVIKNKLYAIGGFDGYNYLKSVERFDADQEIWQMTSCMNFKRLGAGVAVLNSTSSSRAFNKEYRLFNDLV